MKKILFISYGGGHVKSLLPVAKLLKQDKDIDVTAIGLTLAKNIYINGGIKTLGSADILDSNFFEYKQIISKYIPNKIHPGTNLVDTEAYYMNGFGNLVKSYGMNIAIEKIAKFGRFSFYPIHSARDYLKLNKPDLLISSTSPRSELAFINAAYDLNIKSLAISDLFLVDEERYVCKKNYSKDLTVISQEVKDRLLKNGCQSNIHVYGNPAFDPLLSGINKIKRSKIRRKYNIGENEKIIIWALSKYDLNGRIIDVDKDKYKDAERMNFNDILKVINKCSNINNFRFIIRPSPNSNDFIYKNDLINGFICPDDLSIDDALCISDLVLVEYSTVGIQAAIYDLPVIQLGHYTITPYESLGMAKTINNLDELYKILTIDLNQIPKGSIVYPNTFKSSLKIKSLCLNLINRKDY